MAHRRHHAAALCFADCTVSRLYRLAGSIAGTVALIFMLMAAKCTAARHMNPIPAAASVFFLRRWRMNQSALYLDV
jgi:hypothetical protein